MQRNYKVSYSYTGYQFPEGFPLNSFYCIKKVQFPRNLNITNTFQYWIWRPYSKNRISPTHASSPEYLNMYTISISIASNIAGFEPSRFFIDQNPTILIQNMMEYLRQISCAVYKQRQQGIFMCCIT